jgi:hypothetical protein
MEEKEVSVEEKRVFAIGDPFTRVRFPRESGVEVCCHHNFFYATDSTGSFLDPVATLGAATKRAPADGDEIIVNIGEMDLMYRVVRSSDGTLADSAAAVGAAICALARMFMERNPGITWKVAALREDAAFDAFYQKESAAFGSVVPRLVEQRAESRSNLRKIVNLIVSEELSSSPIGIVE